MTSSWFYLFLFFYILHTVYPLIVGTGADGSPRSPSQAMVQNGPWVAEASVYRAGSRFRREKSREIHDLQPGQQEHPPSEGPLLSALPQLGK